ncbi:LysR family transcriptional regulator [Adlercreutzia sp. R25]|uniref:LysR family transcriptional regulator n=1 Tax=Adlercreutzia shanghongiae TaxID=3111773 RepID=UPI002DB684F9|nr:LysR family transcriptional regulator [Adlercreutzia sp. R25]MEC4271888.1 LysR family transcriptional regulator [Adlercreutzia sp. R25]
MLMRQLEYFCAVCRSGSFTKAAEENFVSQSAISQQVKALEGDLDIELIERRGRSFRLTPAGEHFYRKAADILAQLEDLRYEVQGIAGGYGAKLSVGYLNRYEGWEVQAAVAAFAARHPHIEINAIGGSHDELYRMMLAGTVDMAFNDRRRELSDDFENRYLMTGYAYAELSESNPLATAERLTVGVLKNQTAILIASPELEEVERAFYRDHLNFDGEFLFVRSREEGRMLVAGNHGFMPTESRLAEGPSGTILRRIPLTTSGDQQLSHEYYAFWLKSRTTPLVEEFAEILEGLFA